MVCLCVWKFLLFFRVIFLKFLLLLLLLFYLCWATAQQCRCIGMCLMRLFLFIVCAYPNVRTYKRACKWVRVLLFICMRALMCVSMDERMSVCVCVDLFVFDVEVIYKWFLFNERNYNNAHQSLIIVDNYLYPIYKYHCMDLILVSESIESIVTYIKIQHQWPHTHRRVCRLPTNRVSFPRFVFRFQKEFLLSSSISLCRCYVSPVQNNLRV